MPNTLRKLASLLLALVMLAGLLPAYTALAADDGFVPVEMNDQSS